MTNLLEKIDQSFKAIMKGQESLHNVIWYWGVLPYVFVFLILKRLLKKTDLIWLDILSAVVVIIYFSWHIYAIKKCSPKKPKLTKEEEKIRKITARHELAKKFMRKLLLKEPITKWDPAFVAMIFDLYCIADFSEYIL